MGSGRINLFPVFTFHFIMETELKLGMKAKKWERESAELKMDQSEREHVDNVPDIERQNENIDT